jgi:hypothetical protein
MCVYILPLSVLILSICFPLRSLLPFPLGEPFLPFPLREPLLPFHLKKPFTFSPWGTSFTFSLREPHLPLGSLLPFPLEEPLLPFLTFSPWRPSFIFSILGSSIQTFIDVVYIACLQRKQIREKVVFQIHAYDFTILGCFMIHAYNLMILGWVFSPQDTCGVVFSCGYESLFIQREAMQSSYLMKFELFEAVL